MSTNNGNYNKPSVTYPFDPTGTNPENYIKGEIYTVSKTRYRDFNLIVPECSPFYIEGIKIFYKKNPSAEVIELEEGTNFEYVMLYKGATRAIGKDVYGGILLFDLDINGVLWLDYRTVGGDQIVDRNYVLNKLIKYNWDPRTILWEYVTNTPNLFPPEEHYLDWENIKGLEDLLKVLEGMTNQIAENGQRTSDQIRDFLESINMEKLEIALRNLEQNDFTKLVNENRVMKQQISSLQNRVLALEAKVL